MNSEYSVITSEIRELEKILGTIPDENVIERMSFEARLQSAKDTLKNYLQHTSLQRPCLPFGVNRFSVATVFLLILPLRLQARFLMRLRQLLLV